MKFVRVQDEPGLSAPLPSPVAAAQDFKLIVNEGWTGPEEPDFPDSEIVLLDSLSRQIIRDSSTLHIMEGEYVFNSYLVNEVAPWPAGWWTSGFANVRDYMTPLITRNDDIWAKKNRATLSLKNGSYIMNIHSEIYLSDSITGNWGYVRFKVNGLSSRHDGQGPLYSQWQPIFSQYDNEISASIKGVVFVPEVIDFGDFSGNNISVVLETIKSKTGDWFEWLEVQTHIRFARVSDFNAPKRAWIDTLEPEILADVNDTAGAWETVVSADGRYIFVTDYEYIHRLHFDENGNYLNVIDLNWFDMTTISPYTYINWDGMRCHEDGLLYVSGDRSGADGVIYTLDTNSSSPTLNYLGTVYSSDTREVALFSFDHEMFGLGMNPDSDDVELTRVSNGIAFIDTIGEAATSSDGLGYTQQWIPLCLPEMPGNYDNFERVALLVTQGYASGPYAGEHAIVLSDGTVYARRDMDNLLSELYRIFDREDIYWGVVLPDPTGGFWFIVWVYPPLPGQDGDPIGLVRMNHDLCVTDIRVPEDGLPLLNSGHKFWWASWNGADLPVGLPGWGFAVDYYPDNLNPLRFVRWRPSADSGYR